MKTGYVFAVLILAAIIDGEKKRERERETDGGEGGGEGVVSTTQSVS